MGTSVEMIDRTYGHLAPDAENYERELLDAFDAKKRAFGQLSGSETSPEGIEAKSARKSREADARIRTADPFITSEVLYQLSYVGRGASV